MLAAADGDGCIALYSISQTTDGLAATKRWETSFATPISAVSIDDEGKWLAAGRIDGHIEVWDISKSDAVSESIAARLPWMQSIVWTSPPSNPNSRVLAANARWGPIGLWSITTGTDPPDKILVDELVPPIWLGGRGTTALAGTTRGLVAFNLDGRLFSFRPYVNQVAAYQDMTRLACTVAKRSALQLNDGGWREILSRDLQPKQKEIKSTLAKMCE